MHPHEPAPGARAELLDHMLGGRKDRPQHSARPTIDGQASARVPRELRGAEGLGKGAPTGEPGGFDPRPFLEFPARGSTRLPHGGQL